MRKKLIIVTFIALAAFMVFLPALRNEFINWDDEVYVYENPFIRSLNTELLRSAFLGFYAGNWHPLTWLSHALDYALWGLNPLGHHLTNNILHAVNTMLVVLLVAQLLEAVNPSSSDASPFTSHDSRFTLIAAAATGLLFGLHPVHVESVVWVAERKDLLCTLFYLLSVMAYVRYATTPSSRGIITPPSPYGNHTSPLTPSYLSALRRIRRGEKRGWRSRGRYLLALLFFILALLSKPMAVTLPFVLLILDWYPFKRIQSPKNFFSLLAGKLPFITFSLIVSVITILAQKTAAAIAPIEVAPLSARALIASKALTAYLGKLLWPVDLVPLYPYPETISPVSLEYILPLILAAGITITCLALAGKQKLWLAVWGYYVVTLLPVLGIIQVGSQAMADRYTYLPGIGPFFLLGLSVSELYKRMTALTRGAEFLKRLNLALAIALLVSLSSATIAQIGVWKNSIVFWNYIMQEETLRVPAPYYNLGNAYFSKGLTDKAIEQYRIAIYLKPEHVGAHNNLGVAYKIKGLTDRAIEQYRIAVSLKPDFADAHYNLGLLYLNRGSIDMARTEFERVLGIEPDNYSARQLLESTTYR